MAGGIYVIRLSDTHYYGGRTVDFAVRWRTHLALFKKGTHTNRYAQAVYDIHKRFDPEVLVVLPEAEQRDAETKWLECHFGRQGCLNVWKSSQGAHKGWRHSEATKAKFKSRVPSDETRRRLSQAHKGHTVSDATRQKLSDSLRGKTRPDNAARNSSRSGWTHTEASLEKIAEAGKGRSVSDGTKQKISQSLKNLGVRPSFQGRKHSDESRQKMSDAHKGPRNMTDEERQRRSEAVKKAWAKRKSEVSP